MKFKPNVFVVSIGRRRTQPYLLSTANGLNPQALSQALDLIKDCTDVHIIIRASASELPLH